MYDHFTSINKKEFINDEVGLFKKSEKNKIYDGFRNRIIFPIKSKKGHVIGFGGRVIEEEMPKYLNSPENEVFKKGKAVSNMNHAVIVSSIPEAKIPMDIFLVEKPPVAIIVIACAIASNKFIPAITNEIKHIKVSSK